MMTPFNCLRSQLTHAQFSPHTIITKCNTFFCGNETNDENSELSQALVCIFCFSFVFKMKSFGGDRGSFAPSIDAYWLTLSLSACVFFFLLTFTKTSKQKQIAYHLCWCVASFHCHCDPRKTKYFRQTIHKFRLGKNFVQTKPQYLIGKFNFVCMDYTWAIPIKLCKVWVWPLCVYINSIYSFWITKMLHFLISWPQCGYILGARGFQCENLSKFKQILNHNADLRSTKFHLPKSSIYE